MSRNQQWANLNSTRKYPLDATATGLDDTGQPLRSDIIGDLSLQYVGSFNSRPFVSAVAVSARLATVLISLDGSLLASVSVVDPEPGRVYPLEAIATGAFGWIVFGTGVGEPFHARFSSASQTGLLPRAAMPYEEPPVRSAGAAGASLPLTGIVRLVAETPLEITKESVTIGGITRQAAVFRLVDPSNVPTTNVLREFAGPCGDRPESGNCGDPVPIESINAVRPNCDGLITIQISGCGRVSRVNNDNTAIIDCGQSLAALCNPRLLPDAQGNLPYAAADECAASLSASVSASSSASILPLPAIYPPDATPGTPAAFPILEDFEDNTAQNWLIAGGVFKFLPASSDFDGGQFAWGHNDPQAAAARNVAIWHYTDNTATGRKYTLNFKILSGVVNSKANGGLIFNHRRHPLYVDRHEYWLCEVDADLKVFRIRRFDGNVFEDVRSVVEPRLRRDRWYKITVTVTNVGPVYTIAARLDCEYPAPTYFREIAPFTTTRYSPATGRPGLHANRSPVRFSRVTVETAS
jgi:hypothetical protein